MTDHVHVWDAVGWCACGAPIRGTGPIVREVSDDEAQDAADRARGKLVAAILARGVAHLQIYPPCPETPGWYAYVGTGKGYRGATLDEALAAAARAAGL